MSAAALSDTALNSPVLGQPAVDCGLCPRLADFRRANCAAHPHFFNAPVPSIGNTQAELLLVGLAPGLRGANRTGRPFTGDQAGALLYQTLIRYGFAEGNYAGEADDGVILRNCRITNAVRCAPPVNLPEPGEVGNCNQFLQAELAEMPRLRVALALGALAHAALLKACGIPPSRIRFQHGKIHRLPDGLLLADSYHVSRYNTNTGRLSEAMFEEIMAAIVHELHKDAD